MFTDHENLYYRVTHARMLEIIRDPNWKIIKSNRDRNSYGEFRFVTITGTRTGTNIDGQPVTYETNITFYGNGYHEYRDTTPETWEFYATSTSRRDNPHPLSKSKVIREIQGERAAMTWHAPSNNAFTQLADLTDDDFALVEMEG